MHTLRLHTSLAIRIVLLLLTTQVSAFCQTGGTLDPTFGSSGRVEIDIDAIDYASGQCVLPDGRIILYGQTAAFNGGYDYDAILIRLLADGTPDSSFATQAIKRFDIPGYVHTRLVSAQYAGGHLYCQGEAGLGATTDTQTVFIARYTIDGKIDSTFGVDGYFMEQFGTHRNLAGDLAVDDSGRVVFGATAVDTLGGLHKEYPIMGRLTPNGERDSSFGTTGVVMWSTGGGLTNGIRPVLVNNRHSDGAELTDVTLMEGRYLFSGFLYIGDWTWVFTIMVDESGMLVNTYGNNGVLYVDLNPGESSSVVETFELADTIYLAIRGVGNDGLSDFVLKTVSETGLFLDELHLDMGGVDCQLQDACFDGTHFYLAGYNLQSAATPGYQSDYFGIAGAGAALDPALDFGSDGVTHSFPFGDETGASAINEYDGLRLLVSGYIDRVDTTNFTDIGIMRLNKVVSPNEVINPSAPEIRVFPNPSAGDLYVSGVPDGVLLEFYDIQGQLVLSRLKAGEAIDLDDLSAGVYLMRCMNQLVRVVKM